MNRPVYHYPYEVVRGKGVTEVAYLKKNLEADPSIDWEKTPADVFTCCGCNQHWPSVCECPVTPEEIHAADEARRVERAVYEKKAQEYWDSPKGREHMDNIKAHKKKMDAYWAEYWRVKRLKEKIGETVIALQEGGASLEDILEVITAVAEDIEKAVTLKQPYRIC